MVTVEILAIGNELLLGDTLDTNTQWLCQWVTGSGGRVTRAVLLPDDRDAIADELRQMLARCPPLILTTGGLGPTDDDLTLEAVAHALGRSLVVNEQALALVRDTYATLAATGYVSDATLTDSRVKMARLPDGSEPVENPVGAAPAVLTRIGPVILVNLPGVPQEMKAIVSGPLQPLWQELFHQIFRQRELYALCRDETVLAPILRLASAAFPDVYIKSRARAFGPDIRFRITLSLTGPDVTTVEARLEQAMTRLTELLTEAGIASAVR
jgi:molybdenum cofactor synthesis domain-containing protein